MKYILFFVLINNIILAQNFTKQDTLKGSNTNFRNFWNVTKYHITVEADFDKKEISGENTIHFEITKNTENPTFQIDLQQPMQFEWLSPQEDFNIKRNKDFIFIQSKKSFKKGEKHQFRIKYFGQPTIAKNAPWDGGWVFKKDGKNLPFASVAQEGIGVSVWLPTKDVWNDEPEEGIIMEISTEKGLVGVGNGKLVNTKKSGSKKTYIWEVKNPINGYSIVPNIGNYVNFKDKFHGENGVLDLDYWVLEENLDKAQKQFQQVKPMLQAFEYWFGAYPFYGDTFKVVETPYLGMEHQSNIAYGNGYENGYQGSDLSGTGVGLLWDFILIHESGHEWFANNITAKDKADMWIHEAFTSYSETLFTEYFWGKKSANIYLIGTRQNIRNDLPIIGKYGVRNSGSGDMYFKGASMLHTIRQIIDDDEVFREILRGMNQDFRHKTVSSQEIENYISEKSGIDFSSVFSQYLRTIQIPVLEYYQQDNRLFFRYTNSVEDLNLPIKIDDKIIIQPNKTWQSIPFSSNINWNENYFIIYKKTQ